MKMRHSITGGEAVVTQEQFDEVYKDLGWQLVEEEDEDGYAPGESPAEIAARQEKDRQVYLALMADLETGTTPDEVQDEHEDPNPDPDETE